MKDISLKGIIVGSLTDIIVTSLTMIPVIMVLSVRLDLVHLPKAEQTKALTTALQSSIGLEITGFLLGSLCSVLGGYVAAHIARKGELLNGTLSCFLCVGSGIYGIATGRVTIAVWKQLLDFILSPGLGALGGYLRLRQVPRGDTLLTGAQL